MEPIEILKTAALALDSKKAMDIKAVKVDDLTVIADYFIMATATSSTHVRALAEEVEYKLEQQGVAMHHSEGRGSGWILLDYSSVIVHIFSREAREFYALDNVWADGTNVDIDQFINGQSED